MEWCFRGVINMGLTVVCILSRKTALNLLNVFFSNSTNEASVDHTGFRL